MTGYSLYKSSEKVPFLNQKFVILRCIITNGYFNVPFLRLLGSLLFPFFKKKKISCKSHSFMKQSYLNMLFKEHSSLLELAQGVDFSAFRLFEKHYIPSLMYGTNP